MMLSGKHYVSLAVLLGLLLTFNAQAQSSAQAILIKNNVMVEILDQSSMPIKRGDFLNIGDTIHTGDNARAIFRFTDGSHLTMGENSVMSLKDFIYSENEKKAVFEFAKGAFRIITGAITQIDSPNFTVNTPIGSIGIRGTDFWGGNLSDDNSIDVVLLKSEHSIEIKNTYGKVILDKANQGTTLFPDQAPLSARIWPEAKLQKAFKAVSTE